MAAKTCCNGAHFEGPHCPNGHPLGWIEDKTSCDGAGCAIARRFEVDNERLRHANEGLEAGLPPPERYAALKERAERAEASLRIADQTVQQHHNAALIAEKERDAARAAEKDADAWAKVNVKMARDAEAKARAEADALRAELKKWVSLWQNGGDEEDYASLISTSEAALAPRRREGACPGLFRQRKGKVWRWHCPACPSRKGV